MGYFHLLIRQCLVCILVRDLRPVASPSISAESSDEHQARYWSRPHTADLTEQVTSAVAPGGACQKPAAAPFKLSGLRPEQARRSYACASTDFAAAGSFCTVLRSACSTVSISATMPAGCTRRIRRGKREWREREWRKWATRCPGVNRSRARTLAVANHWLPVWGICKE